jgi:UDP-glucose 6-dehydrogenase
MVEKEIARLILKEKDVLVLYLPTDYFKHREILVSIYKQIKERLIEAGKKNKILIIPSDVKIGVIGEEEVKEHVSNIDLWHLFDEEGENL